jgi:hypothetical protein
MSDTMQEIRGFWQRTEGKVGKFVIAATAAVTGYFLWNYSADLVLMLQNTLHAAILLGTMGLLAVMATSREIHNLISAVFKVTMYNLTNAVVAIDPIAVAKDQIAQAKKIRTKMEEMIEDFQSQIKGLQNAINQNRGRIQLATTYMAEAHKQLQGLSAEQMQTREARAKNKARILNARQAARKEQSNKSYQDLLALAERMLRQLLAAKDSADLLIEDKEDDIAEREQRYRMSKSVIGVIKRAKQLRGALQDNELYDMAVERENQMFAQALGMLENFTDVSADFIAKADLANGLYEADAMARLEALEAQGGVIDNIVLKDAAGASATRKATGTTIRTGTTGSAGYDDLFR